MCYKKIGDDNLRYVIVSVVKGPAGNFNNNLRKEVFRELGAKSSKLPAHFTIKAPFEADDISDLDSVLKDFSSKNKSQKYKIKGYDHFDNRVVYMKVNMSKEGKALHDKLIDEISKIPYINFKKGEGKNKVFHVTISSKKIQKIFDELWDYVRVIPCDFECDFDNITVFKWENNTWALHREYLLSR